MVREARAMCAAGRLGKIRKVAVEYFQGWMSKAIETTGHKQAAWRADPAQNGMGGSIGDIGTHAFHLLEYISGLQVTASTPRCARWWKAAGSTTIAMHLCG